MSEIGEENHYVLVIHGTGAAPEPDERRSHQVDGAGPEPSEYKWYQFDPDDESNFCRQLDLALGEQGWSPAVWRRPLDWAAREPGTDEARTLEFSWSGGNSHEARLEGGKKLDQLLRDIREADPRCRIHLVAHSHGGNVVLAALDGYLGWMRHLAGAEIEGRGAGASQSAWANGLDPDFHRLGRLVFLGTPFYYKRWLKGAGWLSRVLDFSRNRLLRMLFPLGFIYVLMIAVAGLVGLLQWFDFIGWRPWQWRWPLIALWLVPSLFAAIGMKGDEPRRDVNLYFPGFLDVGEILERAGKARPLDSLVVSAGFLDEALLVLSAQPLASAFLLPGLREVVQPRWWRWLTPVKAGMRNEAPEQWARIVKGTLLVLFNIISLPVTALRQLLARPLGAWLAGRTRTALGSAALGVPAWELEDARIEVRSLPIDVPGLLTSSSWEIERLLAEEEPPRRVHEPSRHYPFLWDDARLDERLADSQVWHHVERELPAVLRRLGSLEEQDRQARIRRLQRICLTLEARGKEVIESIELLHSAYYARPEFVRVIARFLAAGETPEAAAEAAGSSPGPSPGLTPGAAGGSASPRPDPAA